uniref:Reverse transcriptase domain-containing protein n=1 Tax=Nothobranchius furzeri TaxID=105023 RepID=A0A8C6NNP0_NOTFU
MSQSKRNPKMLFKTISSIVSPASPTASIHFVADCVNFLSFFVDKVNKVRSSISTSALSPPHQTSTRPIILDSFAPVSLPELTKLVNSMKTSACPFDILPSSLFKSAFTSIGPSVLSRINASLVSGQIPAYFKNAVIYPLLKKPSLNPSLHSSFRPISKLPFISKILEKVVAKQLTPALDEHNIYDSFQSGFRRAHSTETALLRVSNDLLTHRDAGDCSVLVLLDLTAAFDTDDHQLILERLRDWVGLSGTALEWFSYLSERSFSVVISKFRSSNTSLTHGVPQGSVQGPLLFLLYLLPLQHILSSFKGISYHLYADDIQLYIFFKPHEMSKLQLLHTCLGSIKTWLAGSFLQLNEDKTEILICAPDMLVPKVRDSFGQLASHTKPSVRNLGVTFDPALTLDSHVSSLVRSSFFHLRNIAKLSPILSRSELETVIHTFISSRLNYCNSLFTCLSRTSLNRLQVVQNACARLLTKSSKHTHITPLLQLHWLPVNFRVHFNILVLVYRALHGQAPSYIGDLLSPYTPSRSLRSSDQSLLVVQHQAKDQR